MHRRVAEWKAAYKQLSKNQRTLKLLRKKKYRAGNHDLVAKDVDNKLGRLYAGDARRRQKSATAVPGGPWRGGRELRAS